MGRELIDVMCFGNPAVPGDSFGPIVGYMLECINYGNTQILGSIEKPITRSTFNDMMSRIRPNSFVIAIDAALAPSGYWIEMKPEPLKPGAAVAHTTIAVGDISIKARIVDKFDEIMSPDMPLLVDYINCVASALRIALTTTRLNRIAK